MSPAPGSYGDIDETPGPGTIVADKYRIEQKLGKGGMGVVVAARHLQLNQLVAIKFLLPGSDPRGVVRARFLREAEHRQEAGSHDHDRAGPGAGLLRFRRVRA